MPGPTDPMSLRYLANGRNRNTEDYQTTPKITLSHSTGKKDTLMRHILALLVKGQTTKFHQEERVASCRYCYNESAIIGLAEHFVMTSSMKSII